MSFRSPHAVGPLAAVVLALACTGTAAAADDAPPVSSVSFDGSGAMVWTGSDAQNFMSIYDNEDGTVTLSDNADGSITPLDGHCRPGGLSYNLICDKPTAIRADMQGARDLWYGTDLGVPVVIHAGEGDDWLGRTESADEYHGDGGDDLIEGGKGADVLDGGAGVDVIKGEEGGDRIQGGAGDDKITADGFNVEPAADVIDGGDGFDVVESDWAKSWDSTTKVAITMGGGADDGRPGENDDVRGIEKIAVNLAGTYVGSPADDEITVRQILDPVTMSGGAGNDRLKTADGPDTLDGGPGADYVDGGFGDDHVSGGSGADTIFGDIAGGDCGPVYCKLPYGNDTIDAVDGEVDSVDCGAGTDTVKADAKDVVAPNCETVERSGPAPDPKPGDNPKPGDDPGVTPVAGQIAVAAAGTAKLAKVLKKGLAINVVAPEAGTFKATAKRAGKKVAAGSGSAAAPGTTSIRLKFTKAARKSLRRKASVKLAVAVTFAPRGGAALKRTVKLTVRR